MKNKFKVGDVVCVWAHGKVPFQILDIQDNYCFMTNLNTGEWVHPVHAGRVIKQGAKCFDATEITRGQHAEFTQELYHDKC